MAMRVGSDASNPVSVAAGPARREIDPAVARAAEDARRREAERAAQRRAQESGAGQPASERRRPRSLAIDPPGAEPPVASAQSTAATTPAGIVRSTEVRRARAKSREQTEKAREKAARTRIRARRNVKEPLTAGDRKATADFRKEELAAYKKLSPENRAKFRKVYDYLYREDRSGHEAKASDEARAGLRTALKDGAMLKVDREGVTTLDHFVKRAGADLAPGLESKGLHTKGQLENLAREVGFPGRTFQGADTRDCVAASMEAQLARREPAEFMRVATGLVFDGKVKLRGPDGSDSVMRLDKRALRGESGPKVRDTTSKLIQQSFMTYARQSFPAGTGDEAGSWAFGSGDKGLSMRQAEGLYENLTGSLSSAVKVTDNNREEALDAILRAGKSGRRFQIGMGSTEGGHMVTLLGIGKDKNGRATARFADSERGGQRRMRWSEFRKLIKGAVLPSEFARKLVGARAGKDDFSGGNIPTDSSAITRPPDPTTPPPAAPVAPAPAVASPPPARPVRPEPWNSYWGRKLGSNASRR